MTHTRIVVARYGGPDEIRIVEESAPSRSMVRSRVAWATCGWAGPPPSCPAARRSDWAIDIGPGAGDEGGRVVAFGPPAEVARSPGSRTAPFLARFMESAFDGPHPMSAADEHVRA